MNNSVLVNSMLTAFYKLTLDNWHIKMPTKSNAWVDTVMISIEDDPDTLVSFIRDKQFAKFIESYICRVINECIRCRSTVPAKYIGTIAYIGEDVPNLGWVGGWGGGGDGGGGERGGGEGEGGEGGGGEGGGGEGGRG